MTILKDLFINHTFVAILSIAIGALMALMVENRKNAD